MKHQHKEQPQQQPKPKLVIDHDPVIARNAAGEPPLPIFILLLIAALAIAISIIAIAVYVFYNCPGPDWLRFTVALLSLGVPLHLVLWALEAELAALEPIVWLRRHVPLNETRDQVIAATGILLVAAVAIVVPTLRAEEPKSAPFTRAATARSALPAPVAPVPPRIVPVAAPAAPEAHPCHLCHLRLLAAMRRHNDKPVKHRRKR